MDQVAEVSLSDHLAVAQRPITRSVQPSALALFEQQATALPDAVALRCAGQAWRYGELLDRVRRLAAGLRAVGVRPADVVAVDGTRSIETVRTLLAIMWAGAVALPFDPAQSWARKTDLLTESRAAALIHADEAEPPAVSAPVRLLSPRRAEDLAARVGEPVPGPPDAEAPAYVFFTSGTTGRPRGVLGRHSSLSHFVRWARDAYDLRPEDRVAQMAALSFDAVLKDIFPALISGAAVCIPGMGNPFEHPDQVLEWLDAERVTVMQTVPSVLGSLLPGGGRVSGTLTSMRLICLSGEQLTGTLIRRWRAAFPACSARFINLYGTTETTILKSWFPVPDDHGDAALPVGEAIDGAQLLVVTGQGRLCGVGELGEVLIRTPYLPCGQLHPAPEDEPLFEVNPFRPDDKADLVQRTGDLGRYTPDGLVEVVGRRDDQVKIRGVRVQPAEVSAVLAHHPDLSSAVVISRQNKRGEPELVAFVVPAAGKATDPASLRSAVAARMSTAAIPAHFVELPALPIDGHGKVDRRALLVPPEQGPTSASSKDDIQTDTERKLAAIWTEVLEREVSGGTDDFFALGGHSLLMTRVIARAKRRFGVDVGLRDFFAAPTVRDFAAVIDAAVRSGAAPDDAPVLPGQAVGSFPLSPEQAGIWYLEQLTPSASAYNMTGVLSLPADITAGVVRVALERLVARHESLRTVFEERDGQPEQRVLPTAAADLTVLPAAADYERALDQLAASAMEPFRLDEGPLLRGALIATGGAAGGDGPGKQLLGLTMHHLVCDGWSWNLMVADLDILIAAAAAGQPDTLPAPAVRYADYVTWRLRQVETGRLAQAMEFWRDQLGAPPPVLDIPAVRTRPPVQTHRGAVRRYVVPPEVTARLAGFCQRYGVTTYMTVLTAFGLVLANAADDDQVVIGTDSSGRDRPEFEDVVGFFVRTHALRLDFSGTPSFTDAVLRVKDLMLDAHPHQHVPFVALVEAVQAEHDPSRTPVFQVMLRMPPRELGGPRRLLRPARETDRLEREQPVKFDLTLVVRESDGMLTADLEYNTDLFEPAAADAMGHRFVTLLAEGTRFADRPAALLGAVSPHPFAASLPVAEQPRAGVEFLRRAALTPLDVAVRQEGSHTTYEEFALLATAIARELSDRDVVALVGGKHLQSFAGLMAAILAGAVVVPIDEKLSAARQRQMAVLSDATVVLCAGAEEPAWGGELGLPVRRVTSQPAAGAAMDWAGPLPPPCSPAFIFFTSGTTGTPKAVRGYHRGLDHFAAWERAEFHVGPGDRVAQLTTFSFDAVLRDIFVPLSAGATVCLPPPDAAADVVRLLEWIAADAVTIIHTTPSVLGSWLTLDQEIRGADLSRLRLICLAGEPLTSELIARFRSVFPECPAEIVNFYGPTETTMIKTFFRVPRQASVARGAQPIGQPLPGTQVAVIGSDGRVREPGERGEIVIRTPYRAEYLVPERGDGFRQNPGTQDPDDLLFYTGDLAVQTADGAIVLSGRRDGLVKVRGIRIHPVEVTAVLTAHPGVAAAHVEAQREGGETFLVAFVVRRQGTSLSADTLRPYLAERLGAKAPSRLLFVDRFPLLPNGKLDRRALMSESAREPSRPRITEPRTKTEAVLLPIWQATLRRERISIDDDFFAVGGHSLLATVLITRIRKALGVELSLRHLLEGPRIEHLAAVIDGDREHSPSPESPSLVTLRDGAKESCFLIHPIGGDVSCYRALAAKSETDRALRAYASPALQSGQAYADLREMAAAYLHEIRTVQPHGPYHLGGWSLGGVIAFEIARQMSFDDEEIASLILLDSYAPGTRAYEGFDGSPDQLILSFARDLTRHPEPPCEQEIACLLQPAAHDESDRVADLRRRFQIFRAHSLAAGRYRGRRSRLAATRVLLVLAGAQDRPQEMSRTLGWERLLNEPPECVEVPAADHYSLLTPPAVNAVAAAVDGWLR